MKIMIVNTLYSPYKIGGAEVSVQLLAEELAAIGNKVRVICLHPEKIKKTDFINGVEVVYLPLKNIYWPYGSVSDRGVISKLIWHLCDTYNLEMKKIFKRELDEFKPDVVHTNNITGFSVSIWTEVKNRNIKLVHTARDYYLFHPGSTLYVKGKNIEPNRMNAKLWSFIKKRLSNKVDVFIGISDFIRKFHINNGFFKSQNSLTIYNAVEIQSPKKEITNDNIIIGFIGRLTEDKGFFEFCEIAEKFKSNKNIKFVAAGRFNSDDTAGFLKERALRNNIELLGFISIGAFLDKVDCVVLPVKWREPFGRTIIECAMSEKIVLTNLYGGITELERLVPNIFKLDSIDLKNITELKTKSFSNYEKALFNKTAIANAYLKAYNI